MKREMHNVEAERALLGGALQDGGIDELRYLAITEIEFVRPEHRRLFTLIQMMIRESRRDGGGTVDMVSVCDRIGRGGSQELYGGVGYVLGLPEHCPSVAGMSNYASIIRSHHNARLVRDALDRAREALLSDPNALLDDIIAGVRSVSAQMLLDGDDALDHAAQVAQTEESIMDGIEKRAMVESGELDESAFGLMSGIGSFDALAGALTGGHITYMCARPGMGKTASMLALMDKYLLKVKRVGVFSLEMGVEQLHRRLVCMRCSIGMDTMKRHDFADDEVSSLFSMTNELSEAKNLQICAQSGMTVAQIASQARKMEATMGGIDVIMIDYYQRIRGLDRRANRREQLEMISADIADLSHDMSVPIIVLAQLNRDCEKRSASGYRPVVSDIGNSDGPNRDADLIVLIHRPVVYVDEADRAGMSDEELRAMEWIVAKNRHGETGTAHLQFIGRYQQITELRAPELIL